MRTLNTLLKGHWVDPDTGNTVNVPIVSVQIAQGVAKNAVALVERLGFGKRIALVCDENTEGVLGKVLHACLSADYDMTPVTLPGDVTPTVKIVGQIRESMRDCDAAIAVGSGTINDLSKYASFLENKPYAVFGTAPSMNGYASANASIIKDAKKQSYQAHLPRGIFLDLDVLAAAPKRLIQAGLGDSLCRPTAQADWLLSHMLLDTEYKEAPFALLTEEEPVLFENAAGLMQGELEAIETLAHVLILSGIGMYLCGGSYPASQGEHMLAHYMENALGGDAPQTYHGEQIGVTTLTMATLQNELLAHATIRLKDPENTLNQGLNEKWIHARDRIRSIATAPEVLKDILLAAEAPTTPQELGWPDHKYNEALEKAAQTRDRFTFLDLNCLIKP